MYIVDRLELHAACPSRAVGDWSKTMSYPDKRFLFQQARFHPMATSASGCLILVFPRDRFGAADNSVSAGLLGLSLRLVLLSESRMAGSRKNAIPSSQSHCTSGRALFERLAGIRGTRATSSWPISPEYFVSLWG
jgi:hypothetical protein